MAETIRDPATDPWHPDPRAKANNPHDAARALQDKHLSTITALLNTLGGRKLTPNETTAAAALLASLTTVLNAQPDLAYHLESNLPRRVMEEVSA